MNSSTSSSEAPRGEASRPATAASLARALAFTLAWLCVIEAGFAVLLRVDGLRESALARPIAAYLSHGESTERRLREAAASNDPGQRALVEAGWIDRSRWRDLPARPAAGQRRLVALYGNSFTRQIAMALEARDAGLGVRMVFGPVAPASHAYASYLEDRTEHEAEVAVMGVVLEMLPGLYGMTRATQSVNEPFGYTMPRLRLVDGALEAEEPVIRSAAELERALGDPARFGGWTAQLERHDAYYSNATFRAGWLDEIAFVRLLRNAWTIRRHRVVSEPVLASLAEPESSEAVALVIAIFEAFAEAARADERQPVALLIETPRAGERPARHIAAELARRGMTTIRSGQACPSEDPQSYAADGHLSSACADEVARQLARAIAGDAVDPDADQAMGGIVPSMGAPVRSSR